MEDSHVGKDRHRHRRRRACRLGSSDSVSPSLAGQCIPLLSAAADDRQSVRSKFNVPEAHSPISAGASPPRGGPTRRPSRIGRRAFSSAKLQELVRYWGTDYDWRKVEAQLNALPMFMTEIDGVDIHFIHVRSRHANALPLIITHGWPGSVIEQLKIIDPLTNPTAHGGQRGGCLRPRDPVDARLRLLRQAEGHGLESRPHRPRLGGADEAPRLHPLCRPGRRLGLPRLQRDGAPGAGRIARHPHQLAGDDTARRGRGARRRRACAGGTLREGTRGVRLARHVLQEVQGLRRNDGHAAADDRLRLDGLSSGACGLDV